MAVLQVRNIDDELYEALGRRAAMDNRSISQEVIAMIQQLMSEPKPSSSRDEEALKLAGSWESDGSAEELAGSIRDARSNDRSQELF